MYIKLKFYNIQVKSVPNQKNMGKKNFKTK